MNRNRSSFRWIVPLFFGLVVLPFAVLIARPSIHFFDLYTSFFPISAAAVLLAVGASASLASLLVSGPRWRSVMIGSGIVAASFGLGALIFGALISGVGVSATGALSIFVQEFGPHVVLACVLGGGVGAFLSGRFRGAV